MLNLLLQKRIFRYLVSGASATATDLIFLYTFTEWLGIWYLLSAVLAFILAFFVSFTLQKLWVFNDRSVNRAAAQAGTFLAIAILNLGINTLGMFVLVSKLHVWYMVAEVFVLGFIAIQSYFLYRNFVFVKKTDGGF